LRPPGAWVRAAPADTAHDATMVFRGTMYRATMPEAAEAIRTALTRVAMRLALDGLSPVAHDGGATGGVVFNLVRWPEDC
jgi:hypothetical protein